ncbi:hypothetical protein KC353_g39 [Hortaea werneckii]|nr:hypothetical protein KC353_g39 [Hortaea werneckii]
MSSSDSCSTSITSPRCVQILSCRAQVFRRLGWAVTSTVSGLVDSEGCRVMRFARLPRGLVAVLGHVLAGGCVSQAFGTGNDEVCKLVRLGRSAATGRGVAGYNNANATTTCHIISTAVNSDNSAITLGPSCSRSNQILCLLGILDNGCRRAPAVAAGRGRVARVDASKPTTRFTHRD